MRKFWKTTASVMLAAALIFAVAAIWIVNSVPDEIVIENGSDGFVSFDIPVSIEADENARQVISLGGDSLASVMDCGAGQQVKLTPRSTGSADVSVSVFGIPVKEVTVTVEDEKTLIVGGQSIGVMLYTKGALVVGTMDVLDENGNEKNPAKDAGLQAGDVIISLNGEEIGDAVHLSELINSMEESTARLVVVRGGEKKEISITPVADREAGLMKMGVWVRDSTAGVGTMSFYDPASKTVAGLGHAIEDVDTGEELSVKEGELVESSVIEIKKGEAGAPGELKGAFDTKNKVIANIEKNTSFGIYGKAESAVQNTLYPDPLPICKKEDAKTGHATILTTVDGNGIAEYSCKITRLFSQSAPTQKSFIVEIDDEKLLGLTGGIVQGMSGSPVIQNGKIVGAVTHVFMDDPTKGYGVYIEWMLSEID